MSLKKKVSNNEIPNTKEKKQHFSGFMMIVSLACLLLGGLLIFIPKIKPIHLCYVIDGIIIALGIILIVHYFMAESFKNLQNYGFSIGAVLLLLGAVGLVKAEAISSFFLTLLGALLLLAAVLKLQNALDLKLLKDRLWFVWFLIAIVFAVLAIVVLLNPFGNQEGLEAFTQLVLFIDGIIGLIGTVYLSVVLRKKMKQESEELLTTEQRDEVPTMSGEAEWISSDREGQGEKQPGIPEDFDAGIDDDF